MWNKVSNSKLFYMVLAVLCAICAWLYVDIVQAPDTTEKISNIPVTFIGEDVLAGEGLMITDGKDTTVTLTVSGPRSAVSQIDRSNITITVQAASQISDEGEYSLTYNVTLPSSVSGTGVTIKSRSITEINVTVVQMTSKTLDIQGRFTGSTADGALFDESDFQFEVPTVTISGERALVNSVDHAEVVLDAENLSTTWSGDLDIILVDAQGNTIDSTDLSCDITSVYATFPVQLVKEVPLTVDFISGGGATENDITYSINPEKVTISGTQEQLAKVTSIALGTIDLSNVVTSDVSTFTINTPDGISIISGTGTASVTVSISGLTTKKFETSNIELINVPDGVSAQLVTQSLEVRVRGASDVLDLVMAEDIYVTVDLSNVQDSGYGTRTLDAVVSVRGFADIGCVGEYKVVANISKS